ncbi:uncharacterized protein EV420DRAFT_1478505 [Desarmillaria tabescens]|uniref:Uncharacterized protein n=1 Tax=Armillaria tabescens TaxID=1929756 RepID=A0AA39KFB2_ARMTA|nr:uncharacterized protein EV420DRAFT_1478505 [Desarmillaria tabescens]KAK0459957.1 hypothetical protein EV420DRAFT_1478505 [Desarmillaria tabescens]
MAAIDPRLVVSIDIDLGSLTGWSVYSPSPWYHKMITGSNTLLRDWNAARQASQTDTCPSILAVITTPNCLHSPSRLGFGTRIPEAYDIFISARRNDYSRRTWMIHGINIKNYEIGIVSPLKNREGLEKVTFWERPPKRYDEGGPWIREEFN